MTSVPAELSAGLIPAHEVFALLLIRIAETAASDTWRNLRHELDRMHLVTLATADGRVAQRSAATPGQQAILHTLDLPEPPKFLDFSIETEIAR